MIYGVVIKEEVTSGVGGSSVTLSVLCLLSQTKLDLSTPL